MIGVVLVIVLAIYLVLYLLFDRYCRRALGENVSCTGTAAGMLAVCGVCVGVVVYAGWIPALLCIAASALVVRYVSQAVLVPVPDEIRQASALVRWFALFAAVGLCVVLLELGAELARTQISEEGWGKGGLSGLLGVGIFPSETISAALVYLLGGSLLAEFVLRITRFERPWVRLVLPPVILAGALLLAAAAPFPAGYPLWLGILLLAALAGRFVGTGLLTAVANLFTGLVLLLFFVGLLLSAFSPETREMYRLSSFAPVISLAAFQDMEGVWMVFVFISGLTAGWFRTQHDTCGVRCFKHPTARYPGLFGGALLLMIALTFCVGGYGYTTHLMGTVLRFLVPYGVEARQILEPFVLTWIILLIAVQFAVLFDRSCELLVSASARFSVRRRFVRPLFAVLLCLFMLALVLWLSNAVLPVLLFLGTAAVTVWVFDRFSARWKGGRVPLMAQFCRWLLFAVSAGSFGYVAALYGRSLINGGALELGGYYTAAEGSLPRDVFCLSAVVVIFLVLLLFCLSRRRSDIPA